jgi:hypothetical protein
LVIRLLDLDIRLGDVGKQRARERAVGPGLAVERGLSRAGGERNEGAFAGFHLGKACGDRDAAAARGGGGFVGERIVAAGVEKHQLDLGVAHRHCGRGGVNFWP